MYVGLDIGTSVVKAVALGGDGSCLAVAARPTRTIAPAPGWQEQDLEDVLAAAGAAIREVSEATRRPPELIGITGQGDGVWLLDAGGRAVRPPILWSDARAAAVVERWMAEGVVERVFRRSGNLIFPGSAAAILAVLRDDDRDALDRAVTAAYCKDAVLRRLTGVRATDVSYASLPFLDIRTRRYDEASLSECGLAEWSHLLAPVDPVPAPLRPLWAEGAALTGLPAGTPVHAGPFDLVATMVGAGLVHVGQGLVILGTTLGCNVLVDEVRIDGPVAGMTLCMPEPNRWARVMAAMVGTPVLEWTLATVGADRSQLDALLVESRPGANGVTALPFLSPAGERAPFLDPWARGQLSGISLETTRADIVRSVCEGIGYAARHCLEQAGLAEDRKVFLCGGGSRSAAWREILADILGRPVLLARTPEVGARGAVMAALEASGTRVDRSIWCAPDAIIDPSSAHRSTYDAGYARYLALITAARPVWGQST